MFSAIYSSQQIDISARSVAIPTPGNGCVLALDPTAPGVITVQGNTTVALNGCSLFSNSDSSSSVSDGGSAQLSAISVGAVGGVSGASGITTTQGITTGDAPLADPYANVSFPSFSGCDQHNFSSHATVTINPGVYCGGMKLNAGANVTMSPGIY